MDRQCHKCNSPSTQEYTSTERSSADICHVLSPQPRTVYVNCKIWKLNDQSNCKCDDGLYLEKLRKSLWVFSSIKYRWLISHLNVKERHCQICHFYLLLVVNLFNFALSQSIDRPLPWILIRHFKRSPTVAGIICWTQNCMAGKHVWLTEVWALSVIFDNATHTHLLLKRMLIMCARVHHTLLFSIVHAQSTNFCSNNEENLFLCVCDT